MKCKICNQNTVTINDGLMLGKHRMSFHRCLYCGFIQTDTPVWLPDAYSSAITSSDLGLVKRNLTFATVCSAMIPMLFPGSRHFVDYGGGYGLFVRLMRDAGFDFRRYDPLCPNLFAQGLDTEAPLRPAYDLVTAFEVFEHLASPMDEIATMLTFGRSVFFSTELTPLHSPPPANWPYYGLEHGQHIAFYNLHTLQFVADKFNLRLYSNRRSLHLLTERNISEQLFRLLIRRRIAILVHPFVKRSSLLDRDVQTQLVLSQSRHREESG